MTQKWGAVLVRNYEGVRICTRILTFWLIRQLLYGRHRLLRRRGRKKFLILLCDDSNYFELCVVPRAVQVSVTISLFQAPR